MFLCSFNMYFMFYFFFFKQKTAYEMRISDWSSDVCSSDLFQEALAAFEAANDDVAITLDLTIHLADEAAWALRRGKADIAYFYALGETDEPLSRYGWSEQINLYAGADHPLARRDSVATGELAARSEEHTSELQSLMRNSYAVFCLKKKNHNN